MQGACADLDMGRGALIVRTPIFPMRLLKRHTLSLRCTLLCAICSSFLKLLIGVACQAEGSSPSHLCPFELLLWILTDYMHACHLMRLCLWMPISTAVRRSTTAAALQQHGRGLPLHSHLKRIHTSALGQPASLGVACSLDGTRYARCFLRTQWFVFLQQAFTPVMPLPAHYLYVLAQPPAQAPVGTSVGFARVAMHHTHALYAAPSGRM
jgi:hypothetical protein